MPLFEGEPWNEIERGTLNPSSHAATEVVAVVRMAIAVLERSEYKITPRSVQAMSGTLAHIIDAAQRELIGSTSRQAFSHARLREALQTALDTMPYPPVFTTAAEMDAWVLRMVKRVNSIVTAAIALWADGPGERPWHGLFEGGTGAAAPVNAVPTQQPDDFA